MRAPVCSDSRRVRTTAGVACSGTGLAGQRETRRRGAQMRMAYRDAEAWCAGAHGLAMRACAHVVCADAHLLGVRQNLGFGALHLAQALDLRLRLRLRGEASTRVFIEGRRVFPCNVRREWGYSLVKLQGSEGFSCEASTRVGLVGFRSAPAARLPPLKVAQVGNSEFSAKPGDRMSQARALSYQVLHLEKTRKSQPGRLALP